MFLGWHTRNKGRLRSSASKFSSHWRCANQSRRLLKTKSRRPPPHHSPDGQPPSERIIRILRRTPKFLHPTLSALRHAPLTHVSAFLLLHEITAVVPLLGLVGAFHYFQWLPSSFMEGEWINDGVDKFGNYFARKGWIDDASKDEASQLAKEGRASDVEQTSILSSGSPRQEGSRTRLVVEFATAWVVMKLLLPVRLVASVYGTPWAARWMVVPFKNVLKRLLPNSK